MYIFSWEIGMAVNFALQTKPAVKTHESYDIPGDRGSGGLMVPQVPSAVRRHSTGNTTSSAAAAVAMVASPAEYQPKLAPRGANGSMDMSAAEAAAMQQQYGLLQIGEGRRLRRESNCNNCTTIKRCWLSWLFHGRYVCILVSPKRLWALLHQTVLKWLDPLQPIRGLGTYCLGPSAGSIVNHLQVHIHLPYYQLSLAVVLSSVCKDRLKSGP